MAEDYKKNIRFFTLFKSISNILNESDKPVVLLIDEVDSAADNQVFLDFLSQLRLQYLKREMEDSQSAFKSVVLSGITDVRHLKGKIRDNKNDSTKDESEPEKENEKVNSPWNIATDFKVRMSFNADEIAGMLEEYKSDHDILMDVYKVSQEIYDYTSGYPFLVSRLCQIIDEHMVLDGSITGKSWSIEGVRNAVRLILKEKNMLFQSLSGKLFNNPPLKELAYNILIKGKNIPYNPDNENISLAFMYGFLTECNNQVVISNRLFETRLYNMFLSEEDKTSPFIENDIGEQNHVICESSRRRDLCMYMN